MTKAPLGGETRPEPDEPWPLGPTLPLTDAHGTPLVVQVAAANTHDINTLLPLVVNLPKVKGKPGKSKWKPDAIYTDKGFNDQALSDIRD